MRLRDIRALVENNYEKLFLKGQVTGNNTGFYYLQGHVEAIDAILNLQPLKFLQDEINKLEGMPDIFSSRINRITVTSSDYQSFIRIIEDIKLKCRGILDAMDEALPEQDENSISIKLPQVNDLTELSKYARDLEIIFNQVLTHESINSKVIVQNFDSGSYWIELAINGSIAIHFVGSLAWVAAVISKKIYEINITKEQVKTIELTNTAREEILKGLEKQITTLCEGEAKNLLHQNNIENYDPEFLGRVQLSIKLLANLIFKGAEVHHAISAPEEVRNLFPDYKNIGLLQSSIKQLSGHTNSTEE